MGMINMIEEIEYFKFQQRQCGYDVKRKAFLTECIRNITKRMNAELEHLRLKEQSLHGCMCDTHGPECQEICDILEETNKQINEYEKYFQ